MREEGCRGARELAALGLWALAFYALLSWPRMTPATILTLVVRWVMVWREPWNGPLVIRPMPWSR
jgi:hypothetical protein